MSKRVGFFERTTFFVLDAVIGYVVLRYAFHTPRPWLLAYLWASITTPLYFIEQAVGSR